MPRLEPTPAVSALSLLPAYVIDEIKTQAPIRDDLLAIPAAEANGWTVSFRNDSWHNGATFTRGSIVIWTTGRDWRVGEIKDDRSTNIRPFPTLTQAFAHAAQSPKE